MKSAHFYSGTKALKLGAKIGLALAAVFSAIAVIPVAMSDDMLQIAGGLNGLIMRLLFASYFLIYSLVAMGQLGVMVLRALALRLAFLAITVLTLLYAGILGEIDIVFMTAVWSALLGLISLIAFALGSTRAS